MIIASLTAPLLMARSLAVAVNKTDLRFMMVMRQNSCHQQEQGHEGEDKGEYLVLVHHDQWTGQKYNFSANRKTGTTGV
jgi:hypothetical protein